MRPDEARGSYFYDAVKADEARWGPMTVFEMILLRLMGMMRMIVRFPMYFVSASGEAILGTLSRD